MKKQQSSSTARGSKTKTPSLSASQPKKKPIKSAKKQSPQKRKPTMPIETKPETKPETKAAAAAVKIPHTEIPQAKAQKKSTLEQAVDFLNSHDQHDLAQAVHSATAGHKSADKSDK